ncbi:MAG: type I DNA topoisomerase [Bryobacterales bacterium]|nr:type I DNA topoisomerase [Bryobacterales bacterium]
MAKNLVIVESPAKAKTIGKYLGKNFTVKASLGHVKDLPKNDIAVDVEHDFRPSYVVIEGKKKLMDELRKAAKDADAIYLAADPDREGEAICFHLQEELTPKKGDGPAMHRVTFNEITANAVRKAFENPRPVNTHLVDAQQARRILDRLVGYKISPLLWDKVRRGLSAGRVQTVALRMIVDREKEIRAFLKREYWSIDVHLNAKKSPVLKTTLAKRDGVNVEIADQAAADAIVAAIADSPFVVKSVATREKKRNPVPPFITSTIQQEAARKLRFSVKRTMMLAQRLYEGVELGSEGAVGLITYMRTDSIRVGQDAIVEVREAIRQRFGAEYLPESPNVYRSKKDAQDAHEAIRPTSALRHPDDVAAFVSEDELKLYRLIWMRFVASQMTPAIFDQTTVEVEASGTDGGSYLMRATGSVPKFDGFQAVYLEGKDQKDEEDEEEKNRLPQVSDGEVLKLKQILPEQHFTEPPPRFTEATLVKELESDGVGRPSTYASILSTIQEREYVKREGGKFIPTELGVVVTELLVESFADIFDITYTARMEDELDEIEDGKLKWETAMADFYARFQKDLTEAERSMRDIKRMEVPTDQVCDKCGKPMVIKWGKHGSFLACTGYPDCTTTRQLAQGLHELGNGINEEETKVEITEQDAVEYCVNCGREMVLKKGRFGTFMACTGYPDCKTTRQLGQEAKKPDVPLEEKCPECDHHLVIKSGRFGEFTACSNYPKCKYVKHQTIGITCPKCELGELSARRSKRGKTFYGCVRYPECDFVAWAKPIPEPCPECGAKYLVDKVLKSGHFAACSNKECKYKKEVADEPVPA